MNAAMYFVGALLCQGWKWLGWLEVQDKGTPRMDYWKDNKYVARNGMAWIVTVIMVGLYLNGFLFATINDYTPEKWAEIAVSPLVSLPAGFIVFLASRSIVKKIQAKTGSEE